MTEVFLIRVASGSFYEGLHKNVRLESEGFEVSQKYIIKKVASK